MHRLLEVLLALSLLGAPACGDDINAANSATVSRPSTQGAEAPPAPLESTDQASSEPRQPIDDSAEGDDPMANNTTAVSPELAGQMNDFGLDLWRRAAPEGNTAMSPASVLLALEMTRAGARADTAAEMAQVLRVSGDADAVANAARRWVGYSDMEGIDLRIANRLFGEQTFSFEQPFIDSSRQRWGAPLQSMDFRGAPEAARATINDWVEEQTVGRIVDLIPSGGIDGETRLALVNAMYLKARWQTAFREPATRAATFYANGREAISTPTMHHTMHLRFAETENATIAELPYSGPLGMTIFLPKERDGLAAVEASLSAEQLTEWTSQSRYEQLAVALPKFRIDPAAPMALSGPLQSMGMREAFVRGQADLTGIANPSSPAERLFISQVFHKAFVEVDERGTEAAAATAVVVARTGSAWSPDEPRPFQVDRPFLFAIRDTQSGAVLFWGRVVDPR